jgi:hypothetical protein
MNPDPRLQQLASEAARKIKTLSDERNADIEGIYRDYQQRVAAIKAESSTDGIEQPPASPSVPSPLN